MQEVLTRAEVLLALNAVLLTVFAYFLRLGIAVAQRSLETIQGLLIEQAKHTAVLKSHSEAIQRHERVIEKLLTDA
jgi:hypothetical protein